MVLSLVQTSNTLFQLKQRLINFLSIDLRLFFHVHVIGPSLITCQIDKIYLSEPFLTVF